MLSWLRAQRITLGRQALPSSGRKSTKHRVGVRRCRRIVAAAVAASMLLPIGASDAGWLSDIFKGSSKSGDSREHVTSRPRTARAKPAASPKRHVERRAASNPAASKPVATLCDPATFRIVVDVGHTAKSEGAISARGVPEFAFNLHLAQRIEQKLKAAGFAATRLLVTEGNARPSLVKRVTVANDLAADFFLSIHHDSVPNKLLEDWEFEGNKRHFSDRFSGYSVWVSRNNPDFKTSLAFAELLARQMKAHGMNYAHQYTEAIMGHYQHPLLNKETGVYSYDELIVLRKTHMPAVLLEAGSIINRDEELKMDTPERRDIIGNGVATAVKQFCDSRSAAHADVAAKAPPQDHPAQDHPPQQDLSPQDHSAESSKPEAGSR
jgi:N-acetylmuramoyl-L-alanine amidase